MCTWGQLCWYSEVNGARSWIQSSTPVARPWFDTWSFVLGLCRFAEVLDFKVDFTETASGWCQMCVFQNAIVYKHTDECGWPQSGNCDWCRFHSHKVYNVHTETYLRARFIGSQTALPIFATLSTVTGTDLFVLADSHVFGYLWRKHTRTALAHISLFDGEV